MATMCASECGFISIRSARGALHGRSTAVDRVASGTAPNSPGFSPGSTPAKLIRDGHLSAPSGDQNGDIEEPDVHERWRTAEPRSPFARTAARPYWRSHTEYEVGGSPRPASMAAGGIPLIPNRRCSVRR
jgi:hypothetical protein